MDQKIVEGLCELLQHLFAEGSDELKLTAIVTIQAWVFMLQNQEKRDASV